jgi:hypothetical protein
MPRVQRKASLGVDAERRAKQSDGLLTVHPQRVRVDLAAAIRVLQLPFDRIVTRNAQRLKRRQVKILGSARHRRIFFAQLVKILRFMILRPPPGLGRMNLPRKLGPP